MSDTANTANLASGALAEAGEFDARLKRTDEDRWLATRYAPREGRERLVAIYLLHQELQRTLQTKEAMLGKIRVQWWRETLEQIASPGPVRRHDLALELARVTKDRTDLIAPLNDLVDRYDDIIDDHIHAGGHQPGADHEARHLAAEASLARVSGLALDPKATADQLDALSHCGEAHLAIFAKLSDASARWASAKAAADKLSASQWPAVLHLAAVNIAGKERSPFSRRWAMFSAMLLHRLPAFR